MQLPEYFLPRPTADWGPETVGAFSQLFDAHVQHGSGAEIDYQLPAPKWQFLCYLCEQKDIVLHGSGKPDIEEFEPRQSNDVNEFGNRRAIYAASDGIWPMYFAIVDRERYVTSLVNSCFRVITVDGRSEPYYYFSINGDALPHDPWRNGMIYILPAGTFQQQPHAHFRGVEIELTQWASAEPARPLAKLAVQPQDFPFLSQIHPHDPAVTRRRAVANPDAFPWLDD